MNTEWESNLGFGSLQSTQQEYKEVKNKSSPSPVHEGFYKKPARKNSLSIANNNESDNNFMNENAFDKLSVEEVEDSEEEIEKETLTAHDTDSNNGNDNTPININPNGSLHRESIYLDKNIIGNNQTMHDKDQSTIEILNISDILENSKNSGLSVLPNNRDDHEIKVGKDNFNRFVTNQKEVESVKFNLNAANEPKEEEVGDRYGKIETKHRKSILN